MAVPFTKLQRNTLKNLRGIIREIRQQYDVENPSNPGVKDLTPFTNYVMQQYRVGSKVTDKSKAKTLRTQGADFFAYLEANKVQQDLIKAYRGVDADKPMQRHAAAKYVGLTIPESVPLGRSPNQIAQQYDLASKLQAMSKDADLSKLTGLDNLKAQYYGIEEATGISRMLEATAAGAAGFSKGAAQTAARE